MSKEEFEAAAAKSPARARRFGASTRSFSETRLAL